MKPVRSLKLEQIELSDPEFWTAPLEEREGAFATLREEAPLRFFKEWEMPPEFPLPRGPCYWALTKH